MITLAIDAETEKRVIQAAQAEGLEPGVYAGKLVSKAIPAKTGPRLTSDQFKEILDRLAASGRHLPALPEDAYSRESMYQDHD